MRLLMLVFALSFYSTGRVYLDTAVPFSRILRGLLYKCPDELGRSGEAVGGW